MRSRLGFARWVGLLLPGSLLLQVVGCDVGRALLNELFKSVFTNSVFFVVSSGLQNFAG